MKMVGVTLRRVHRTAHGSPQPVFHETPSNSNIILAGETLFHKIVAPLWVAPPTRGPRLGCNSQPNTCRSPSIALAPLDTAMRWPTGQQSGVFPGCHARFGRAEPGNTRPGCTYNICTKSHIRPSDRTRYSEQGCQNLDWTLAATIDPALKRPEISRNAIPCAVARSTARWRSRQAPA